MVVTLKSSTFRALALGLGLVAVSATVAGQRVFWVAVGSGALFGLGGYLFDYLTRSRYVGGQVSSWAFAAGAAVVALYWSRTFVVEGRTLLHIWWLIAQYGGVVLLSWSLLMFALPARHNAA